MSLSSEINYKDKTKVEIYPSNFLHINTRARGNIFGSTILE
jgi:hypothetical protein